MTKLLALLMALLLTACANISETDVKNDPAPEIPAVPVQTAPAPVHFTVETGVWEDTAAAEDGTRSYYENADVRKATLHAVGDLQGNIGTGALNAFADKLTGYSMVNGAFAAAQGCQLYLTIDARYNYEAYRALNGHAGVVAVYNYKTGEILCMVSAPSYDPLHVPEDIETNDRYEGAYLNRFLSASFTPGSVYKTVTAAAAIEQLPDLEERTWSCGGSVRIGEETIVCSGVHGEQTFREAMANSCNVAFAELA